MMRFIILVIIGGAIYLLWKWTMTRYERRREETLGIKKQGAGSGNVSELVQDPVCKLYITKEKAIEHKGEYFCSEKCKNEYRT